MQVTETHAEGLKREYRIVISAKDIGEKLDDRLHKLSATVRLPGFRPGKVPVKLIKQRYGPSVMGEVLEHAVRDSSTQALNERGLRPAMRPKIEIKSFDEGKDLEYTMELELLPEVEPMDFKGLQLERIKVEVPDSEVDEAVTRLASAKKTTKPLESPRPAVKGDVLVIDFKGSVDGEALPGMEGEGHHLELGSNRFVAGFEEQLIGISAGEERTVTVTFPETYVNDKLAGREAIFEVAVKEVLEGAPMAIDDELAKAVGEPDLKTLRDKLRQQIGQEYEQVTRVRLKRQLLDKLAEGHDFEVPTAMVDAEFEAIWKQVDEDRKNGSLDPEDREKSEEQLRQDYRDIAERRVRLGLLLSEVGRINAIDVTQEEVHRALLREAQRYPGREREVIEFFQKTPEALANLRAPIFEDKVIDFIVDLAKVDERKVTPESLRSEMDEDTTPAGAPPKKAAKAKGGKKAAKEQA